jgi:hypothetical protein
MIQTRIVSVLIAGLLLLTATRAQCDETASADDTARFLAGMQPSSDSPLARLTQERSWQQHASIFDAAFANVEKQQLAKIREWSSANLNAPRPVMYYLFSGPDFLYANAFFPNASTYVLGGLEPAGQIPDLMKLSRGSIPQTLRNIEVSLNSVLTVSYFITANMAQNLSTGPVSGTLPILYVFLTRSGKVIREVSLVHIDERGILQSGDGSRIKGAARGVKIVFTASDGRIQTLYYFSTNLADEPGKSNGFLEFCKQFGQGDSFLKSASYLLHNTSFSQVRNFLLDYSALVLQDDTGIPVGNFDAGKWLLSPFGRYVTPISIFQNMYQPKLTELYQKSRANPIDFGIGYRWRANESNLLLAKRNYGTPDLTDGVLINAVPPRHELDRSGILSKAKFPAQLSHVEDEDERETQ